MLRLFNHHFLRILVQLGLPCVDLLIQLLLLQYFLVEIFVLTHLPCIYLVKEFRKTCLFLCLFMYVRLEGRCEIVWVFLVFHILLNLFKFIYFLVSLRKYILIPFMNWQNGIFSFPFLF